MTPGDQDLDPAPKRRARARQGPLLLPPSLLCACTPVVPFQAQTAASPRAGFRCPDSGAPATPLLMTTTTPSVRVCGFCTSASLLCRSGRRFRSCGRSCATARARAQSTPASIRARVDDVNARHADGAPAASRAPAARRSGPLPGPGPHHRDDRPGSDASPDSYQGAAGGLRVSLLADGAVLARNRAQRVSPRGAVQPADCRGPQQRWGLHWAVL